MYSNNFLSSGAVVVASRASCPYNFEAVGDQCLLLNHENDMTWGEAEWFCQWNDAELILLKDKESQDEIYNFLNRKGSSHKFWIGAYFKKTKWYWIDGTQIKKTNKLIKLVQ